jgi:hypothetical protein
MLWTVTDVAAVAVVDDTFVTLNVTPAGTVTLACSLTFAVNVVVWLVSGRMTDCCAEAVALEPSTSAPITDPRRHTFLMLVIEHSSKLKLDENGARGATVVPQHGGTRMRTEL